MAKQGKKALEKEIEYQNVKLLGGRYATVPVQSIVGFCHYAEHKGCVTIEILREHDCINKNCSMFEKFEDYPYWKKQLSIQKSKETRKNNIRKKKEKIAAKEAKIAEMKEVARGWVAQLRYPIKITNIIEDKPDSYKIYFVSDSAVNDAYAYNDIAAKLHLEFRLKFKMIRVKKPNGGYVKLNDTI